MAEVDDILLGILRQQLNCDIPEDITSVRSLSTEMLVEAVAKCLRNIDPEANAGIPVRLSSAMATKYRQAATLAEACKNAGFSSELGYEAFLYGGEGETRKLLMFLVDKLPKEDVPSVEAPAHGSSLAAEVRNRLREEMERPWLPLSLLQFRAFRHSSTVDPRASVFRSQKLSVPLTLQQAQFVPILPAQCSTSSELGSSVIEYNALKLASWNGGNEDLERFKWNIGRVAKDAEKQPAKSKPLPPPRNKPSVPARRRSEATVDKAAKGNEKAQMTKGEQIKELNAQLEELTGKFAVLMAEKASASAALQKAEKSVREGQEFLTDFERTLSVKEAIAGASSDGSRLTFASVTGEIGDLRAMLANLHEQWDSKKASLLHGFKSLQDQSVLQQNRTEKLQEEIRETKQRISSFHGELNEREEYLDVLKRELDNLGSLPTRASYTKRILEIVASIKKQKVDIDKIIRDTRVIQKEINTLSGRLERAFTEIEELMFRDAKSDELARKAYKCVAIFHEKCAGLIRTVESTGVLVRESKDLEDEAASLMNRKVEEKLQNVLRDLKAVKDENASLEATRHGQGLLVGQ
ncbi:hypothetical protein RvY_14168 [Ramazzottius varieornatus]|uniref:Coiled-coil domain-containing protein 22 homolog n=1 Tax=Ramazzottius varieornatus TaxID=947166 RepID=A0A1D1VVH2_RAMVA|nr:hypothetical protein RvY_14168 [Ramazzottius varieornatus]